MNEPCRCSLVGEFPKLHALLERLEDGGADVWEEVLANLNGCTNVDGFFSGDDVRRFVGEHTWRDPVTMHSLGQCLAFVADEVRFGPGRLERLRAEHAAASEELELRILALEVLYDEPLRPGGPT